jgi:hypothetical protein
VEAPVVVPEALVADVVALVDPVVPLEPTVDVALEVPPPIPPVDVLELEHPSNVTNRMAETRFIELLALPDSTATCNGTAGATAALCSSVWFEAVGRFCTRVDFGSTESFTRHAARISR